MGGWAGENSSRRSDKWFVFLGVAAPPPLRALKKYPLPRLSPLSATGKKQEIFLTLNSGPNDFSRTVYIWSGKEFEFRRRRRQRLESVLLEVAFVAFLGIPFRKI